MTASEAPLAGVRVDRRVMRLAALFVQPDGCYAGLPDVDTWPEARDARRYTGPLPVVAHPPCQLWGAMAVVNYARWGGDHNKPGNDGGCFAAALDAVRTWGGVLEHPAKTKAWAAHGLAKPEGMGWQRTLDGGWVCEVWQSAYGHRAAKATWLYYHGTNPPFELRWARPEGTHQIGFHDQRGKAANKPTLGKREANATPLEFRDELLRLACLSVCRLASADFLSEELKHLRDEVSAWRERLGEDYEYRPGVPYVVMKTHNAGIHRAAEGRPVE